MLEPPKSSKPSSAHVVFAGLVIVPGHEASVALVVVVPGQVNDSVPALGHPSGIT